MASPVGEEVEHGTELRRGHSRSGKKNTAWQHRSGL